MKLTVIGASGSYPGPESPASCYVLEEEHEGRTWRVLLDLGNGALGVLHRYVDPMVIDAVLISHLHADHCLDMCGFYVMRKYHPDGPAPKIPVWGPKGTARRMARAYDLPKEPGMDSEFDFRRYGDDFTIGPFTVHARRVSHPVRAYALRISAGGRVLAYSGDTGACSALIETAQDADVFLCEASFLEGMDNPPDLHLTGKEAAEAATAASVGQLLLTHVPPWHDPQAVLADAKPEFSGPLELVKPGTTYDI